MRLHDFSVPGASIPPNSLEQVSPPLPPFPFPFPLPSLPLPLEVGPLLQLWVWGSALAAPAGPGGATVFMYHKRILLLGTTNGRTMVIILLLPSKQSR